MTSVIALDYAVLDLYAIQAESDGSAQTSKPTQQEISYETAVTLQASSCAPDCDTLTGIRWG